MRVYSLDGCIRVKSVLSGMPELKLGLADRIRFEGHVVTSSSFASSPMVPAIPIGDSSTAPGNAAPRPPYSSAPQQGLLELQDLRFHECVRLDRFAQERVIWFVPPDGTFDLVLYRTPLAIPASGASVPRQSPDYICLLACLFIRMCFFGWSLESSPPP